MKGSMTGLAVTTLRAARRGMWLGLVGLLLMVTGAAAQEATSEAPAAGEPAAAPSLLARRDANFVRVDGAPKVPIWARGLADVSDLDDYAALGMNTAYLLVTGISEQTLESVSTLSKEAAARGLMVVVGLAPEALQDAQGADLAPDARSEDYGAAVKAFADKAAAAMEGRGELIAWSVEAVPPEAVVSNDDGFRDYLQEGYDSLGALNDAWGTEFEDWDEITTAGVRDIDTTKPGGLGRASVDLAYYRKEAYAEALWLWATALREADPERLVLASALTDYRSIISVGRDFDGLVVNAYPSLAEADTQTHNVHAVDIARGANQFAAVQTLEVTEDTEAWQLVVWGALALQHGAAGVAFSNWGALRDSEELRAAAQQIVTDIAGSGAFPLEPVARAAVLYEPLAGGAMRDDRGLYGYLDGFAPSEPSMLFGVGRNGSRYGQFDVLALESLGEVDLGEYGVIIAPMALYLPQDAQLALHNFVLSGGTLLADAGAGMYQADGVVTSLPPVMREVFGVRYDSEIADLWGSEAPDEVKVGEAGGYGIPLTENPEEAGVAYNEDLNRMAGIVEEVLDRPTIADFLGIDFLNDDAPEFRVNAVGAGYAIYAPRFLYEDWDASDYYFEEFHARVLAQGSDFEVVEPEGVWPGVSVAERRDWTIALASPNGEATALVVYGVGNQLYRVPAGAARLGNPDEVSDTELLFPGALLAFATPLPIYVVPTEEEAVATVSVVEYTAERIELLISGTGAEAFPQRSGIGVDGGAPTAMEIEIADGAYKVDPGSSHRVTVREGQRRAWDQEVMPNPETGSLVIRGRFGSARVAIEPSGE